MIYGARLAPPEVAWGEIKLACKGKMAIMPGAKLWPAPAGSHRITLDAGPEGTIVQYGGSISPAEINCRKLILEGGEILPFSTEQRTKITYQELENHTGQDFDPRYFHREGYEGYVKDQVSIATPVIANQIGVKLDSEEEQPELVDQERVLTPEEAQEKFNSEYTPHVERRVGKRIIRGYNLPADSDFTTFKADAKAGGWSVDPADEIGKIISVTIEKTIE
jgi:hypothetical protein